MCNSVFVRIGGWAGGLSGGFTSCETAASSGFELRSVRAKIKLWLAVRSDLEYPWLQVEAPAGYHVHSTKKKAQDKFDFVAIRKGLYKFCFYSNSPIHETIVFDVHIGHLPSEHAKDGKGKSTQCQIVFFFPVFACCSS